MKTKVASAIKEISMQKILKKNYKCIAYPKSV